jgi:hypothetical protein
LEAFQEIYAQLASGVRRYLSHLAGGSEIADDLLQENVSSNAPVESRVQPGICGSALGLWFGAKRFSDESPCGPAMGKGP